MLKEPSAQLQAWAVLHCSSATATPPTDPKVLFWMFAMKLWSRGSGLFFSGIGCAHLLLMKTFCTSSFLCWGCWVTHSDSDCNSECCLLIISPNMLMLRFYFSKINHSPWTENVVFFSPFANHWSENRHLMLISQVKRGTIVTYSLYSLILGDSFFLKVSLPLWLDAVLSSTSVRTLGLK